MDEPLKETIMEVREGLMVSPAGDSKPALREAHFLKPISKNSIDDASVSEALSLSASSVPPTFDPKKWPLTIHFTAWRSIPPRKWVLWVDTLAPKHESLWKKVGIFEAIMSTKCQILKSEELAIGVAEKWCSKTNTFVFPWAEATITLEDVMVLGGYPLVGEPVFITLENKEMKETEEKLVLARKEAGRSKHNKASISAWMDLFINSVREIEHEAFLATWLSLFVFHHDCLVRKSHHHCLVSKSVFPMAVYLARGNPVALAPAVLASIYKDLGLLKRAITGLTKNPEVGNEVRFEVTLRSPFYLVQVWVWERFKNLQPLPNKLFKSGDPMLARWNKVKALQVDNVREKLNKAVDDFLWRPYARYASKWKLFYPENEMWVPIDESDKGLDKDLVSYVKCLRVSGLVGFGSVSFVKQYLPHRVAMQFGMDQDVPACVPTRFNETQAIAWENYCRPISDKKLYFPSRLFEADVTPRYVAWWRQSVLDLDPVENIVQKKRSARSSKNSANDADVPPVFHSKQFISTAISGKSSEAKSRKGGNNDAEVPPGFPAKRVKTCGTSSQGGAKAGENCDADDVPMDCFPEHENQDTAKVVTADESERSSSSTASTADYGAARTKISPQAKVVVVVEDNSEEPCSMEANAMEEDFEDASGGSREQRLSCDKVSLPAGSQGEEGYGCSSKMNIAVDLEERISRLERLFTQEKMHRLGRS